ncbi:MAG: hypothetical protein J6W49_01970 [Paludibacteraceae bacterium]|nr:hypothetical protein [Paludibacteraceae bacterium]
MRTVAKALSYLFHPLLAGTYCVMLMFLTLGTNSIGKMIEYKIIVTLSMFIMTFIVPAVTFLIMKKKKIITDMEMSDRRERTLPYIFTLLCYAIAIYSMYSLLVPYYVLFMLGAGVLAMALMCFINHFWKISAHSCGMGALTGFLFVQQFSYAADYSLLICIIILLSGAVASARIYLNAHTLLQTVAGFLTGFSFIFIAGIIGFLLFLNY